MKSILISFTILSAYCFSINAQEQRFNSSYKNHDILMSYTEIKNLNTENRNQYLRKVSHYLRLLDRSTKIANLQEKKYSYNIIELLFLSEAYAADLRCIGGGVFVPTGASTCGVQSYAGYSCPANHEICNPLIFGVRNNNEPVCQEQNSRGSAASTDWCHKNTKPGFTTNLDLVFEKEEARNEWADFSRNVEEICLQSNRSQIEESDRLVNFACNKITDQTRRNRERIEEGLIDANFEPLSQTQASSGICTDCSSGAPVIDDNISELVATISTRGVTSAIPTTASPVANPIGWDAANWDRNNGRCGPEKNNLRGMPEPNFPEITSSLVQRINQTLSSEFGVDESAFNRALSFYQNNKDTIRNSRYITVVDMSQPAENHRKFLIDLESGNVEGYYVSHGRGTDPGHTGRISRFSNTDSSNSTPEGFHLTGQIYNGKYGSSLTLHGQEVGTNDNSCGRSIVIHRATQNGGIAPSSDSTGNRWRSNGCFAMNEDETQNFINRTQNGSVYYVHSGN